MALTRIAYGGDVESGVLNDNFEYLDGKITDVGSSITTVQSNIQSVSSTLSTQISTSISTTLQTLYPVGSIYIGTMSTCPLASLFGTWTLKSSGRVLQGSDEDHEAGTTIAAGLPNLTGWFVAWTNNRGSSRADGSLFTRGSLSTNSATHNNGDQYATPFNFNASGCNSTYGSSDTVQPPAYVVNIWERTA